jgi:hypothetical protein
VISQSEVNFKIREFNRFPVFNPDYNLKFKGVVTELIHSVKIITCSPVNVGQGLIKEG